MTQCEALVSEQYHDIFSVYLPHKATYIQASLSGALRQAFNRQYTQLVAGDRVIISHDETTEQGRIETLLPRRSLLTRVKAGTREKPQPMAANADYLLICTSMNEDFNPRRLERYLSLAQGTNVKPVLVLTKADLAQNPESYLRQTKVLSLQEAPILCSVKNEQGLDPLRNLLREGQIAVLMGSSGVGKSSLINALLGENRRRTADIGRYKDKGRHTTTSRALIPLTCGAYLIDTPGMRELKLDESDTQAVFPDIQKLAASCRFRDCSHQSEPGCAVAAAVVSGDLDAGRLKSYQKLRREEEQRKHW